MDGNIVVSFSPEMLAAIEGIVRKVMAETQPATDDILTGEQIQKMFSISHPTLQKWRDKKLIPFFQVDNKILYCKGEVLKALSGKITTTKEASQAA